MTPPKVEREVNAEYAFIIRIPSFGQPSRRSADLLETLRRHVQVSICSVATVEPYKPRNVKKTATKSTKKSKVTK